MGVQTKTVGGGPATGLANDFVQFLMQGLNTGTFGAGNHAGSDAIGQTRGIAGVLNDILSNGGGTAGGALRTQIENETNRNAADLRARFGAQGGTAFGTGAQFAEGVLRSESAPKIATAVGNLQLAALSPILQAMMGLSERGIPQAENITTPSALGQITQGLGAIAPIVATALTPAGAAGVSASALTKFGNFAAAGPQMPNPYAPVSVPNIGSITI